MTLTTLPTQIDANGHPELKGDSSSLETALRLPDTFELLTHLKLVDAIICLKNAVDEYGEMNGTKPGKAWDQFCQAAAAKFLEWFENVDISKMSTPTPSLDVLMIWHSYILNTKDYVHFQNEAFGGRMAGRGIDWQDLKRKLDFDYDGMADILEAWDTSESGKTETPKSNSLPPPTDFDMVAAVQRQLRFAEKVHNAEWRRPEILNDFLDSAVRRYQQFFTLIAENPGVGIAPTLAIDLVWHTHQLSPKRYRAYCLHTTNGRFVHHDDNLDESALEEASHNAEELYFSKYGIPYKVARPMCFSSPMSRKLTGPGGKAGLAVTPAEPSSCSSRCSSRCSTQCTNSCGSVCSSSCGSVCSSSCGGGRCANQCRAACGYVCGACETKSD